MMGSTEINLELQNKLEIWKEKKKVKEIACQFWIAHCMTEDPAVTCTIPYS
jgi:hypothetical protein